MLSYLNAYYSDDKHYAVNPCMQIEKMCRIIGKQDTLCKYEVCINQQPMPKSVYVLIQKKEASVSKEEKEVWRIEDAFPYREKGFTHCNKLLSIEDKSNLLGKLFACLNKSNCKSYGGYTANTPAVLVDYNRGWRKAKIQNNILYNFLKNRPFIIRTLDPTYEEWKKLRTKFNNNKNNKANCIWVAQITDMSNGNLWIPCTWEKIRSDVTEYLWQDTTLRENDKWKYHIIILISNEGVLIFGPNTPKKGRVLLMPREQPGAFSMRGYGKIIGGTTVFISAIVDCIFKNKQPTDIRISLDNITRAARKGLYLKRRLIELGFIGHDEKLEGKNITEEYKTNLPFSALKGFAAKLQKKEFIEDCSNTDLKKTPLNTPTDNDELQGIFEILQFVEQTKRDTLDYAYDVISLEEQYFNKMIVLKFEKYITASPQHAQNILRLAGQLEENILHEDSKIYWLSGFSRGNIIYCNDKVYKKTNIYYGR